MNQEVDPVRNYWASLVQSMEEDDRLTGQLRGFLSLVEPKGVLGETLYLEVPDDLTRQMLEQKIRVSLLQALSTVEHSEPITSFAVVVNPEISRATQPNDPSADAPMSASSDTTGHRPHTIRVQSEVPKPISHLNEKYNFDSFVIGASNRLSYAAAFAVAEGPAKAYNPLFIYGGSGLGKTHLLHAIGNYAQNLYPDIRVRYVSSEEFTNDFINSVQNNEMAAFNDRYRNIDILLIDDIQFLQGKEQTHEAFFHTYNTLHSHNKQVVITSDLPPKQLTGFEDRMRSRFEWGLLTDVQAPDLETRIAILRKKAQSENVNVPQDILEYIASKISSNVRELEGSLIRVTAYSSLNQKEITLDLVQTILKDTIGLDEDNMIAPMEIIHHTAKYYGLTIADMEGSSRSHQIASARQIAMYLCRELTNLSLPKIGTLFGGRDHTTVMYANTKVGNLIRQRQSVYNQVTELSNQIREAHRFNSNSHKN